MSDEEVKITNYHISHKKSDENVTYSQAVELESNIVPLEYQFKGLKPETQYDFKIQAEDNKNGLSAEANTSATTKKMPNTKPTTPQKLKTYDINQTSITLSWEASSDDYGVSHYLVAYKESGGNYTEERVNSVNNKKSYTSYIHRFNRKYKL